MINKEQMAWIVAGFLACILGQHLVLKSQIDANENKINSHRVVIEKLVENQAQVAEILYRAHGE